MRYKFVSYKKKIILIFCVYCFLFSLFSLEGTLKNFKIPLFSKTMDEQGYIKGSVAKFISESLIEILNPNASFLVKEMQKSWNFKTTKCFLNKNEQIIYTDEYSQVDTNGLYIDGDGLNWDLKKGIMTVGKNVTVDIDKNYSKKVKKGTVEYEK